MSVKEKSAILLKYFRSSGRFPRGCVTVDDNGATIGNVTVDGTFYGVFDYVKREFLYKEDF